MPVIGPCPYPDCEETHMVEPPEGVALPIWVEDTCEGCKRQYWLKLDRLIPEAYTPEEFKKLKERLDLQSSSILN